MAAAVLFAGPALVAAGVLLAPAGLRQDLADLIAPDRPGAPAIVAPVQDLAAPDVAPAMRLTQPAEPSVVDPAPAPSLAAVPPPDAARALAPGPIAPESEAAPKPTSADPAPRPGPLADAAAPAPAWPLNSLPDSLMPPDGTAAEAPAPSAPVAALLPARPDASPRPGAAEPLPQPFAAQPPGLELPSVSALASPPEPTASPEAALRAALAQPSPETTPPPTALAPSPVEPEAAAPGIAARITLHYPRGASVAADTAASALDGQSASPAELVPVGFSISQTNVRYYHAADRPAAERIAGLLEASSDGAVPARDFTGFRPSPPEGLVEVWVAGEAAAAVAAYPPPAATPSRPPPPAAPRQTSIAERAAQIEAQRARQLQQQVERMLADQLRQLQRQ